MRQVMLRLQNHSIVYVVFSAGLHLFTAGFSRAQDFEAIERRLGGAVEAGELTLEQANIMLNSLRGSAKKTEIEVKKKRYMEIARQIESAVKSGKLSKQDAEKKLVELQKQLFGDDGGKSSKSSSQNELEAKKKKYMEIARQIESAVKSGKLSKQDAEKKLIELQKQLFGDVGGKSSKSSSQNELEAKKRKFMEYARQIEAAVKSGKLSKEKAQAMMKQLQDQLKSAGVSNSTKTPTLKKKSTKDDLESRKRQYAAAVEKIQAALKKKKIEYKDAEKKMTELRRKLKLEDKQ